jgi:hypothetical protein
MSENTPHRHGSGAPVWGIILLFAGILLLLQTLNVLPWSLWDTLWRFWPALIIIIGLGILLRHTNAWLVSLIVIVILGACLGTAIWQHGTTKILRGVTTRSYSQPVGNLQTAQVDINFNAGKLTIENLPLNSANLVEANTEVTSNVSSMQADFRQQSTAAILSLDSINQQYWPNHGVTWDVKLTPKILINFNINSSASTLKLDLSDLNLSSFAMDINAGSCDLKMPAPSGIMKATVKANAASVSITIPEGAATRIQASSNVATLNVNNRFIKRGNDYVTDNYDTATSRIELTINTNVGTVSVK